MAHHATVLDAVLAAPPSAPFVTIWRGEGDETALTFGELTARAGVAATRLQAAGVRPGDRVVLVLPQDASLLEAFVGALWMGAVPAILAYPTFKVDVQKYRAGLRGTSQNLKARAVVIDPGLPSEVLEDAVHGGGELVPWTPSPSEAPAPPHLVSPDDLALIQHSAGTTGLQKAVALSHRAVMRQLANLDAVLRIAPGEDAVYSWLPLYHDMGLIACLLLPLVFHLRLVMQSPESWVMDPARALQLISAHRCTLAWMPNFAFAFLARRVRPEERGQFDLASLRALVDCSEPVRTRSLDEFADAYAGSALREDALHASYAMAENVFAVTHAVAGSARGPRRLWLSRAALREGRVEPAGTAARGAVCLVSSGRCLPGNELRIVDAAGSIMGPGIVGEIMVRSDSLFDGYYNRPDLTAAALRNGWYASGDLGFSWDEELFVTGRKNDLIIVAGRNIYPEDVEECAAQHPAIRDGRTVALGVARADLGTEEIVVVAEVAHAADLADARRIELEVKSTVTSALGVAVARVYLRSPGWVVKSTAGKPARRDTRRKLAEEEPGLGGGDDGNA